MNLGDTALVSVTDLGDVDVFVERGTVTKTLQGHDVIIKTSKATFRSVNVHFIQSPSSFPVSLPDKASEVPAH